jgi:hypothetical protein
MAWQLDGAFNASCKELGLSSVFPSSMLLHRLGALHFSSSIIMRPCPASVAHVLYGVRSRFSVGSVVLLLKP